MNVLLGSPFFSQHWDAGHYWARALSRLGHRLVLWDWRTDVLPPPAEYDVSIVLKGTPGITTLLHLPVLLYFPDDFDRFPEMPAEMPLYTRVFTMVRPTPEGAIWLPGAWDETVHRPRAIQKGIDSLFIGTATPYKETVLHAICPQVIAGNGWAPRVWEGARFLPPVYLYEFAFLLSQAKVAINVHRDPRIGLGRRFFEFIACAMTITDLVPGVTEILGQGLAERVAFSTSKEGRELVHFYLTHPEEREAVWLLEREAIKDYTYTSLAQTMLRALDPGRGVGKNVQGGETR